MDHPDFWSQLEILVSSSELVIDRPKGSAHPRYPNFVYPFDYGYLEGTSAADGGGIDVWVGSRAGQDLVGVVCTVDLVKRDSEMKILLGCTREEAEAITKTHQEGGQSAILIWRERGNNG